MKFKGFRSIAEYERECASHGFITCRIPFTRGNEKFFVLITALRHGSPAAIASWHLIREDESAELMDGVIDGNDENYLGMLAKHGFFQEESSADC